MALTYKIKINTSLTCVLRGETFKKKSIIITNLAETKTNR